MTVFFSTTPSPPSVANGGFAPLCGAAATPVAALKAPVASQEEGTTGRQPAVGAATQPVREIKIINFWSSESKEKLASSLPSRDKSHGTKLHNYQF